MGGRGEGKMALMGLTLLFKTYLLSIDIPVRQNKAIYTDLIEADEGNIEADCWSGSRGFGWMTCRIPCRSSRPVGR